MFFSYKLNLQILRVKAWVCPLEGYYSVYDSLQSLSHLSVLFLSKPYNLKIATHDERPERGKHPS